MFFAPPKLLNLTKRVTIWSKLACKNLNLFVLKMQRWLTVNHRLLKLEVRAVFWSIKTIWHEKVFFLWFFEWKTEQDKNAFFKCKVMCIYQNSINTSSSHWRDIFIFFRLEMGLSYINSCQQLWKMSNLIFPNNSACKILSGSSFY